MKRSVNMMPRNPVTNKPAVFLGDECKYYLQYLQQSATRENRAARLPLTNSNFIYMVPDGMPESGIVEHYSAEPKAVPIFWDTAEIEISIFHSISILHEICSSVRMSKMGPEEPAYTS